MIPDDLDSKELEDKETLPLVGTLVEAGIGTYGANNKVSTITKVCEAMALNPNDKEPIELLEQLGENACQFAFHQTVPGARATLEYNGVDFAFRYCPPGAYTMGAPFYENCLIKALLFWFPVTWEFRKKVTIDEGFWICEVPTTQEQWDAVGYQKGNEFRFKGTKLPVDNVTWYESNGFVKKLNESGIAPDGWYFALLTEEQWEYACRAGTTGATYGYSLDDCAWYCGNSGGRPHDVGSKKPNKWGIYDMLGNVWEWTCSQYNGGSSLVGRGGSWYDPARYCRPAKRDFDAPTIWLFDLGFRVSLVRSQSK